MAQKIRFGIAGLGLATGQMLSALIKHPNVEIVAAASVREEERNAFSRDFSVSCYDDIAELCRQESVDAVYVSTPTPLHVEHVLLALQAGKHVVVEKPLATDLASAERIVDAARRCGRVVVVGHSHSFDPPVQRILQVVESGRLGKVRMIHNWCYSDWLYRPRTPDELRTELGGGVTFRQGAHQFDIIRYIGGGQLRSVRAMTGQWDPSRATEGSHVAYLEFENSVAATAIYNGYGHFHSNELTFGIGEWGHPAPGWQSYGSRRKRIQLLVASDELQLKRERSGYKSLDALPKPGDQQPFFGLTIVSCERGDIRQSADGLLVYADNDVEHIALPKGVTPHDNVIQEFCDAVLQRKPAVHSAEWGLATLEVCLAVLESAARREEIYLKHQVSLPATAPAQGISSEPGDG